MLFHKIRTIHDGCIAESSSVPHLVLDMLVIQIHFYLLNLSRRPIMRSVIGDADITLRMGFHVIQLDLQLVFVVPIVIIVAIADIFATTNFHTCGPICT